MSLTIAFLTKIVSNTFARPAFIFVLFASIKSTVANIRAYVQAEENKKQEEIINDLKSRLALKDRIISIISHDIRSPLDSLTSLLELLSEEKVSQQEFQEVVSLLNQQVDQLSQFLETLLKWIKNLTTEIKPNFDQIYLHHIADDSVALFTLQAKRKKIKIQSRVSADTVIYADKEMIKLVLRNLINNAVKFCKAGDLITVGAKEYYGEVHVFVEDTGQGISQKNISRLFDVSHLSTAGTKNEIGTGLGLNLCKEFVEKMGGKIRVTSIEGNGSKFEFTIHSPSSPSYEFQQLVERHDQQ